MGIFISTILGKEINAFLKSHGQPLLLQRGLCFGTLLATLPCKSRVPRARGYAYPKPVCPPLDNALGAWNPRIPCLDGPKPSFEAHIDLFSWVHTADRVLGCWYLLLARASCLHTCMLGFLGCRTEFAESGTWRVRHGRGGEWRPGLLPPS